MSDCCCKAKSQAPSQPDGADLCPRCGGRGKSVDLVTLKSLLTPLAMRGFKAQDTHRFCRTPDCPVAYFGGDAIFTKSELTVPVWQKERDGSTPVCYCFGFTKASIAEELSRTGKSSAIAQIAEHVEAGKCACDIRNPQGSCCLGNVAQVVRELVGVPR